MTHITSITAFAEALQSPATSLRTLGEVRVPARHEGGTVSRTAMFAEARIETEGGLYLLCAPLTETALREAAPALHAVHLSGSPILTEYRLLPDEIMLRDSTGRLSTCDLLLHRLPEGETLDCAVTHIAAERLEEAIDILESEMLREGIVHNNLKPSNLIFTDDGLLYPIRYHYLRTGAPSEATAAEIMRLREYVRTFAERHCMQSSCTARYESALRGSFDEVSPLHDMMRRVRRGGLYGFVDERGRTVLAPQFLHADDFCENRSCVETASGMGVIDRRGRYIVEPRYDYAESDCSGGFLVRDGERYLRFDYAGRLRTDTTCD